MSLYYQCPTLCPGKLFFIYFCPWKLNIFTKDLYVYAPLTVQSNIEIIETGTLYLSSNITCPDVKFNDSTLAGSGDIFGDVVSVEGILYILPSEGGSEFGSISIHGD